MSFQSYIIHIIWSEEEEEEEEEEEGEKEDEELKNKYPIILPYLIIFSLSYHIIRSLLY
jgi:hypothetical protein